MSDKTQITAHSGSDGTPDNSLACVEYALSTAADAFEVDVRRLADGTLALGHDAADHTAPTLREVLALAAAKPGVRINCDLKERGLEPDVAALAAECGMSGRLIFSGSVDVNIFAAHPELHDCAEVYLNIEEYVPDLYLNYRNIPDFELTAAEIITKVCREHGIATVNMNQVLITRQGLHPLPCRAQPRARRELPPHPNAEGQRHRPFRLDGQRGSLPRLVPHARRPQYHDAQTCTRTPSARQVNKTPSQREHSRAMAFSLEIGRFFVGQRTGAVAQTGGRGVDEYAQHG